MDDRTIYHVTTEDAWRAAREAGVYRPASLDTEGFIHCSLASQVAGTVRRHFAEAQGLVVLSIDVSLLRSAVHFEDTHGRDERLPHIYGPLDLVAVRSVYALADFLSGDTAARIDPAPATARLVRIVATNYDGSPHWSHPARLLHADESLIITATDAGLAIERVAGAFTSPFNTRGHYWPDRYFNVIRLEEPGRGLTGYYCNIAMPQPFDGENVRYADLQLDVRVYADAGGSLTWALLDEDEFEVARLQYGYDEALVARCRDAVAQIVAMVEAREFPFDG